MSGKEDNILVSEYIAGDDTAINKLISKHIEHIDRVILKRVKNKAIAEDIRQDTIVHIMNQIKKGMYRADKKGYNFKGWITTITRNQTINYLRAKYRNPTAHLDNMTSSDNDLDFEKLWDIIGDHPSAESETIEKETKEYNKRKGAELFNSIIEMDCKEIIRKRIIEGKKFKHVSEEMGDMNENTVRGKYYRTIRNLREKYEAMESNSRPLEEGKQKRNNKENIPSTKAASPPPVTKPKTNNNESEISSSDDDRVTISLSKNNLGYLKKLLHNRDKQLSGRITELKNEKTELRSLLMVLDPSKAGMDRRRKNFISYQEAKEYCKQKGIKSSGDYTKKRSRDMPSDPRRSYRDEWKGWDDFLSRK